MKSHASAPTLSYRIKKTIIRSGIFLILLGLLAVPLFSAAASKLTPPLATLVTGGAKGLVSSSVLSGNPQAGAGHSQLLSMLGGSAETAFPLLPQAVEAIAIYQGDCTSPATDFALGTTICAKLSGAPIGTRIRRRLAIVNPAGLIVAKVNVVSDPQSLTFSLPQDAISTFDQTTVDNRGTWRVNSISTERGGVKVGAKFVVRDPAVPVASLSVTNNLVGSDPVADNSVVTFSIQVTNTGPDSAANVQFTDAVPANSTLALFVQESGPTFSCTNTSAGATGTSTCSITTLAKDAVARFRFAYQLGSGLANGTVIVNSATVTSDTLERHTPDNTASSSATVSAGGASNATCTLDCPNNITVSANTTQGSTSGANVTFPGTDSVGDCGTLTSSVQSGSFFPVGTTTVTVTSTTGGGACSFTVTVLDNAAPTISCPPNKDVETTDCAGATVDPGTPTATGSSGITITGERSDGQDLATTYPVGDTFITWTARDPEDRIATCQQRIRVTSEDTQNPTIVAPPDINTSTPTAEIGSCGVVVGETELGTADANDNCTVNVTRTGVPAGNFFPVGTTVITYTATDAAGNIATDTQSVIVADGPPVIFAPANASYVCPSEVPAANPSQASGPDIIVNGEVQPGPPADSCSNVVVTVADTSTGAGSASDPLIITRTFTATDAGGHSASAIQIITVADPIAPTVTAPADSSASANASCQAAIPNYAAASTASDNCGTPTITQTPAAGTLVGTGSTTVTVTATDSAGNSSTDTVVFTVNDTTAPVLTCPADVVVELPANSTATSMAVNFSAPTATDNCSAATVSTNVASGSVFPVGTTTVNATATDAVGNQSTCSFTVTVRYRFSGFFSPVENLPTLNVVNAGRAIPVKFSLSGDKGLNIFAANSPSTVPINCDGTLPEAEVIETVTAGGSSLSYQSASDQYHYIWKTENAWAGTCRQLVVKLNDGTEHKANFKFR